MFSLFSLFFLGLQNIKFFSLRLSLVIALWVIVKEQSKYRKTYHLHSQLRRDDHWQVFFYPRTALGEGQLRWQYNLPKAHYLLTKYNN